MSALPMPPKATKKCFVAFLDSHFGAHFATVLANQDYEVSGIVRDPANAAFVPAKIKKVYRRGDSEPIRKALIEADYVVYHTPESVEDSIKALRILSANHYETEKRLVLVSSVLSWFETVPLQDPVPSEDPDEPPELEALTEDQYNRRVPHIKYQAWRDVEKLCCSMATDRLKTFVVFAGLMYGLGEHRLQPLFRQAWTLAPEGLPMYGNGNQLVPMIHTADCGTFVQRILTMEEIPESRYYFAVDEGNCTWKAVAKALSTTLGNGKVFKVPPIEFGLHDNIEHFVVNLKIEASQIQQTMPDESDWVAKTGFVENIEKVCQQFREIRGVTPLRIVVLGPPSSGKSYTARELGQSLRLPSFNIGDIIAEYKFQETELAEEILRLKAVKLHTKREEKLEEKRQAALDELRAKQAESLAGDDNAAAQNTANLDDEDDLEEEEQISVKLTKEEEDEIKQAVEDEAESDEAVQAVADKLTEVKRVLAMKAKAATPEVVEPANPKDKKAKPAPKAKKADVPEVKEEQKDAKLSDRALALMVRWKLTRTECRNQGYVLDGFPKTVKQLRLIFEDAPLEVPEDPEEAEPALEKEERPFADNLMPDFVIHAKASDTFLLERLLKTQHEHPHNNPEDFQRRLEAYKTHFDVPLGVIQHFESARSASGKTAAVRSFEMESAPLVPPPPPKSAYQPKVLDASVQRVLDFIGKAHNFGLTPEDAHQEAERSRLLAAEQKAEQAAEQQAQCEKEATDVKQAQEARTAEAGRVRAMKDAERAMLEQRKGPLKGYLMANVIPVLTKGLIEVCNARPEDPVDFLAEWLFRHNPEDHPELYC